jgi:hypothetical protein
VVRLGTQVADEVRRRIQQAHWAAAATNTTPYTRSAGCSATAQNTSPRSSKPKSGTASRRATRPMR